MHLSAFAHSNIIKQLYRDVYHFYMLLVSTAIRYVFDRLLVWPCVHSIVLRPYRPSDNVLSYDVFSDCSLCGLSYKAIVWSVNKT